MDYSNTQNKIVLHDSLNAKINQALTQYDQQIDIKNNSKEWDQLQEELVALYQEIGWLIVRQNIVMPF